MTLLVEDGTNVTGAESYCTVAYAQAYHVARGSSVLDDLDDEDVEALLRRATDYMTQVYRSRWRGSRMYSDQALDWPRGHVYLEPFERGPNDPFATNPFLVPNNIVPKEVMNACAELALRAQTGALYGDLKQGVVSKSVGPISITYDRSSPESPRFPAVDAMLALYLGGGGVMHRIVRT